VHAVDHRAELSGVDEQGLTAAVAEATVLFVAREKPQADRDLRRIEELAGECHHAIDEIGLDDRFADLAFAGLVDDIEPLASTNPAVPIGARW
jgi:hypothetical protein